MPPRPTIPGPDRLLTLRVVFCPPECDASKLMASKLGAMVLRALGKCREFAAWTASTGAVTSSRSRHRS
eukprot:866107-Alexandrium_andersonii.AAC.1